MMKLKLFLTYITRFSLVFSYEFRRNFYEVTSGIGIPNGTEKYIEFTYGKSPKKFQCTMSCLSMGNCLSAYYSALTLECHLLTCIMSDYKTSGSGYSLMVHSSKRENSPKCFYRDCQEAFENGDIRQGGIYSLRPNDSWIKTVEAVCQFDSMSGWTVMQRRLDGSQDFYRYWNEYVEGFGNVSGEYWLGLEAIHWLTKTNKKLSIYLEAISGETRTANYSKFYIDGDDNQYMLHISGYRGDAGDSLAGTAGGWWGNHNGVKFSTRDRDNDPSVAPCAVNTHGAWWFRDCLNSHLNGKYYRDDGSVEHTTGTAWNMWSDNQHQFKTIYMRFTR